MTSRGWLPVATGAITFLLALWVALTFVTPEPEPASAAQAAEAVPVRSVSTTTTAPTPVVITTPPPEIDGVSESIARVLSTHGFASEMSTEDVAGQLPPTVLRTLIANGAVLSIATEEDSG
ncbi:MAG: hypothetical protein GY720_12655 [bacterium]|nr:hypothetical protein [bacterium]